MPIITITATEHNPHTNQQITNSFRLDAEEVKVFQADPQLFIQQVLRLSAIVESRAGARPLPVANDKGHGHEISRDPHPCMQCNCHPCECPDA